MSRRATPKKIFSDNGTNFNGEGGEGRTKKVDFGKLLVKYDQIKLPKREL